MSFSIGIVGLPNVGKSTLFKILTKREVKISGRPFTTIEPNIGIVTVPDERLEMLAKMVKPEKVTPTTIEFFDIAGLVKGAHRGEGLGNQFLSEIRNCHSILLVLRAFEEESVENILNEVNPQKEFEILKTELLMKDLETIERSLEKLEKKKDEKKIKILERLKENILRERLISEIELNEEEREMIVGYQFLTQKPMFALLNINGKTKFEEPSFVNLKINLKDEEEFLAFSEAEKKELKFDSQIPNLIRSCYQILNLITFFTITGGKEVKAWTAKKNSLASRVAKIVHSDFEKKFIKAEVINWKDLVKIGSWQKAKQLGLIKTVGKDYLVKDGEVIEFKI